MIAIESRGIADGIITFKLFTQLDEESQNQVRFIVNRLERYFGEIYRWFPEYTPHQFGHVIAVIDNIERLVVDMEIQLSNNQKLVLLLSAITHDIGMAPKLFDGDPDSIDDYWKIDVREDHHNRSARFIQESRLFEGLDDSIKKSTSMVAKGHRRVSLHGDDYKDQSESVENLAFMAALLRLADELEITMSRVQFLDVLRDREAFLSSISEESRTHWESHIAISKWKLSRKGEVIEIHGNVTSYTGHLGIELVREGIRNTLEHIRSIPFGDNYCIPNSYWFDLTFENLATSKYKVELDSDPIIDFLIHNLYTDNMTPIRELVQNSQDACRIYRPSSGSYIPEVIVTVDESNLIISDNGRGMDLRIIDRYLKVAGKTFNDSPDFKYLQIKEGLSSEGIGKFGIGIFSSFMITDSFIVKTKIAKDTSSWYQTTFTKSFCPTIICEKPDGSFNHGTLVEFKLSEEIKKLYKQKRSFPEDVRGYLNRKFLRPRIKITLIERGFSQNIGRFPLETEIGPVTEPYISITDDEYRLHALADDSVFVGICWNLSETIRGVSEMTHDKPYGTVAICLEGTQIEYLDSSHILRNLVDFVKALTGKFVIYSSIAVIDFQKNMVEPSLNREAIVVKSDRLTSSYLKDCIPPAIKSIYDSFIEMDKEHEFWNVVAFCEDESIFELLDTEASTQHLTMINPHTFHNDKGQLVICNEINQAEQKLLECITLLAKFFKTLREYVVNSDTGWIPVGGTHFFSKYAVPQLIRNGWKLDTTTSLDVYDFAIDEEDSDWSEGDWFDLVIMLNEFPISEREAFVRWLIPVFHKGTRRFHTWLRHQIYANRWEKIGDTIIDMKNPINEIVMTQVFLHHIKRDDKNRTSILSIAETTLDCDIDLARLYSLIEKWDDAIKHLEKHIEVTAKSEKEEYFSTYMTISEFSRDFSRLRKVRSEEYDRILQAEITSGSTTYFLKYVEDNVDWGDSRENHD